MVRDVFRLAKENAPSIIFIDEVRALSCQSQIAQWESRCAVPSRSHAGGLPSNSSRLLSGDRSPGPRQLTSAAADSPQAAAGADFLPPARARTAGRRDRDGAL